MMGRWADRDHDLAWTVALVSTAANSADNVIVHLGGRPTQYTTMTYEQALRWRNDNFNEHGVVQVHRLRRHTVLIEPNGWNCADNYLAQALSRHGGHYISAYWSPSSYLIVEARNGITTARFDPLYVDGVGPQLGEIYPSWLDTTRDFADDDTMNSTSLALIQRATGVGIRRRWLRHKLPTYRIPAP